MNSSSSDFYPESYFQSRQRFLSWVEDIKAIWPNARLESRQLPDHDELTVDWIRADGLKTQNNMILLTSALHGVEGFVGSAIQKVFKDEFLSYINPNLTGITLVHSINPWGMFNKRRVNPNNVDLNRNFMQDKENFQTEFNPGYVDLDRFLNPQRTVSGLFRETIMIIGNVIKNLTRSELGSIRGAILLGQRSFLEGLYHCGQENQVETQVMIDLINSLFQEYRSIYQIDLHTGYGPRYQMSLVSSPNESRTSEELQKLFQYPRVLRADPDQFYQMQGDMIDWVYHLQREHYPESSYYGTAFEFGTYGSGVLAEIASLRTTLLENQAYFHGTGSERVESQVKKQFLRLYFPSSKKWKTKALEDSRQAFMGILKAFHLIEFGS